MANFAQTWTTSDALPILRTRWRGEHDRFSAFEVEIQLIGVLDIDPDGWRDPENCGARNRVRDIVENLVAAQCAVDYESALFAETFITDRPGQVQAQLAALEAALEKPLDIPVGLC